MILGEVLNLDFIIYLAEIGKNNKLINHKLNSMIQEGNIIQRVKNYN